ncbi:MAG TPA: Zn-dependent hydrolase [Bacteroidales bacterium]|nr:MAG: Zn-dependent hydrolase [Bacteroidetes bacterium GWF2_33_38]OFY72331.1 MAG: Zn-dependent hydrolase [Bacteroidetes bacterium RIFOXYA12_FULL_33_9]OFY92295.1 MAG: Zn-dependent hydrolase [Bacteroidetes bacterium RIFOXYA2_FULL_33_7]HBF87254.1 Zn-dependent hydrolase [Bacteroidales bacterium]
MIYKKLSLVLSSLVILFASCDNKQTAEPTDIEVTEEIVTSMEERVSNYIPVQLTSDLSGLSENEKLMIPKLIEASKIIDEIFWKQAFGDKEKLFSDIKGDDTLKYVQINYGPWDRLASHKAFIERYGKKPLGANFYPSDIKYLQFVDMKFEDKFSAFTLLSRMEDGTLYTIPYNKAYKEDLEKAAGFMKEAAELAEDEGFKKYLNLRAEALLNDNFFDSDMAWMDMKNNTIDFLIGPVEDIEDRFLNIKAAYESYILIKDQKWTDKLDKISSLLPKLQASLPVDEIYKKDVPGKSSDIGVYDAIYYAGYCNSGPKNISINRPLDGRVQLEKGNRKLEFKNVMQLKFDKILHPIATVLIDENQLKHVQFHAFFENSLLYEIGDALGIKYTINNQGSVKEALKEEYSTISSSKAEVLRLYLATQLHEMGELNDGELMDNYVTQMANMFRSVRFGAGNAQGKANMIIFNYFQENGAFNRDAGTGKYSVNFDKMKQAVTSLVTKIITIQGNGDYRACVDLVKEKSMMEEQLKKDITRISEEGIKTDLIFEQGLPVLGL